MRKACIQTVNALIMAFLFYVSIFSYQDGDRFSAVAVMIYFAIYLWMFIVIWRKYPNPYPLRRAVGDWWCTNFRDGCCTTCEGTGCSFDIETNGRCWDCRGTGHVHRTDWTNRHG